MNSRLHREVNLLEALGILFILAITFYLQIFLHQLPCPLCLLQRFGMLGIAFGFLLNVEFGPRSGHYGIALLSCVFTASIAARQMLLHIVPGSGTFGEPLLGLHLYTWVFILASFLIVIIALMLLMEEQFYSALSLPQNSWLRKIMFIVFIIAILITLLNALTTFAECGWLSCPENPTHYIF